MLGVVVGVSDELSEEFVVELEVLLVASSFSSVFFFVSNFNILYDLMYHVFVIIL